MRCCPLILVASKQHQYEVPYDARHLPVAAHVIHAAMMFSCKSSTKSSRQCQLKRCTTTIVFVCSIALRYPSKVKDGRLGDSRPLLNRSVTLHPAASMQRDCQNLPSPYATTSERDTPKLPFPIITMLNLPTSKYSPTQNQKSNQPVVGRPMRL